MADISFDEEQPVRTVASVGPHGMAAWMIQNKFAKDEKSANIILIGVVVVCVVTVALLLFMNTGGKSTIDAAERLRLEQSTTIPR